MAKKKEEHKESAERWLISYADFITLLMVFFVVMYSMSKVDQVKFYQLAQSLNSALIGGTGTLDTGSAETGVIFPIDLSVLDQIDPEELVAMVIEQEAAAQAEEEEISQLLEIEHRLAAYFVRENLNSYIYMTIDSRGLVVSLNATVLFDPGSAVIKPEMADILVDVGGIIDTLDNFIRVEGHTDNVPIGNSQYKSNWDLSTARATNVLELFIDRVGIKPEKLVAAGYSEYRPIASNDTPEDRSKNRRVDMIILSSKYNEFENPLSAISPTKTPAEILEEAMLDVADVLIDGKTTVDSVSENEEANEDSANVENNESENE
jgi:chemotaxis protein MotB